MGAIFAAWWDLIYNALVSAVSLNWGALVQIGQDIRTWWDNLWAHIVALFDALDNRIDAVRTILRDMIFDLRNTVLGWWQQAEAYTTEQIQAVIDWLQAELTSIGIYLDSIVDTVSVWVQDLLASWLQSALDFISPYIDAVGVWVQDTFGWILDSYTLLTEWLASVRDAVTWLAAYAWSQLTAFLADPWGFVLGQLGGSIIGAINWWLEWSQPLSDFLTQDLPALRNFMAQGLGFLQTFMDNPLQTILDLLYPVFLDWLEQVIAENW